MSSRISFQWTLTSCISLAGCYCDSAIAKKKQHIQMIQFCNNAWTHSITQNPTQYYAHDQSQCIRSIFSIHTIKPCVVHMRTLCMQIILSRSVPMNPMQSRPHCTLYKKAGRKRLVAKRLSVNYHSIAWKRENDIVRKTHELSKKKITKKIFTRVVTTRGKILNLDVQ